MVAELPELPPELLPEPPPEGGAELPELLAPVPEEKPAQPEKQNTTATAIISNDRQPEPVIDVKEFLRS